MSTYKLPKEIRHLVHARNLLRERYSEFGLSFTLDGNLVGDLGEAVAAELFGLQLVPTRGQQAVDAIGPQGLTIQIKATGRGKSLTFTHSPEPAAWLIGLVLSYETEKVEVVYNGPYAPVLAWLGDGWLGQKPVSVSRLKALNAEVSDDTRLKPVLS